MAKNFLPLDIQVSGHAVAKTLDDSCLQEQLRTIFILATSNSISQISVGISQWIYLKCWMSWSAIAAVMAAALSRRQTKAWLWTDYLLEEAPQDILLTPDIPLFSLSPADIIEGNLDKLVSKTFQQ